MNGLILLEDLEEEDLVSDYKSHQNHHHHQRRNHKGGGSDEVEVKRQTKAKDTTGGGYQNHLMVDGHYHRRKSISAEPVPLGAGGLLNGDSSHGYGGGSPSIPINGHYSSLSSVNNAITVAPSRTTFLEPNVFAGGRSHHNNHHHRKQAHNNHRKHKGRSRSPDDSSSPGVGGYQSILNRIDNSILKNFGDWTNVDDEGSQRNRNNCKDTRSNNHNTNHHHHNNNNNNNNMVTNGHHRTNNVPYFIPKQTNTDPEDFPNKDLLSLPQLYKGYDTVVKTSKQVLNDKSYRICLSKDNSDPNSILSEAKRTLAQFGGD